jgi:hypothetical protein
MSIFDYISSFLGYSLQATPAIQEQDFESLAIKQSYINALQEKDFITVKTLLEKGVDPNIDVNQYGSALNIAITNNQYDIALLMIEKGIDVNKVSTNNNSPIIEAIKLNAPAELIQSIANHGLDLCRVRSIVADKVVHFSPLYMASYFYNKQQINLDVLKLVADLKLGYTIDFAYAYWVLRNAHKYDLVEDIYSQYHLNLGDNEPSSEILFSNNGNFFTSSIYNNRYVLGKDFYAFSVESIDTSSSKFRFYAPTNRQEYGVYVLNAIDISIENKDIIATKYVLLDGYTTQLIDTTITAPHIYLPTVDHISIHNSNLIGEVHYMTPQQLDYLFIFHLNLSIY